MRGHVELTLSVDRSSQQKAGYNRELVDSYLAAFAAAREEHELGGQPDLNAILRLPGALQSLPSVLLLPLHPTIMRREIAANNTIFLFIFISFCCTLYAVRYTLSLFSFFIIPGTYFFPVALGFDY